MIDTNRPNPNLETYRNGQLKAVAAGTGPTFSSISKTYDGTYSAQRLELVEGYAAYGVLSAEFISRISRPVYEQFIAVAVASGALKVPAGVDMETLTDATYMPPAMPWIDPRKEAEAWALLEDRCYASGPEIIRKRGGNPLDVLEQEGRWRREKEAEGVPHNAAKEPTPAVVRTEPEES
jgi:lambda family phage portal protein